MRTGAIVTRTGESIVGAWVIGPAGCDVAFNLDGPFDYETLVEALREKVVSRATP